LGRAQAESLVLASTHGPQAFADRITAIVRRLS
jgi:hypothetical protein